MTNPYTPGPWKACRQMANTGNVSIQAATQNENLQVALATSNDWGYELAPNRESTVANAQLIAAAPKLLAECKRTQDELASALRDGMSHFDAAMVARWLKGVNEAIDQAEGKLV